MRSFDIEQNIMVCVKVGKILDGEKVLSCTTTSNMPVYLKQRDMQASDFVITVIPLLTSDPDKDFSANEDFSLFLDSANECFSGCAR